MPGAFATLALWISTLTTVVLPPAPPPVSSEPAQLSASRLHTIVFATSDEIDIALTDAIARAVAIELDEVGGALRVEPVDHDFLTAGDRIERAAVLARRYDAVGVFLIEPGTGESILVRLIDHDGGRELVRVVPLDPAAPETAIEAVAVIIRASTLALSHGERVVALPSPRRSNESRPTPPPAPPPSAPARVRHGRFRATAGYAASAFSDRFGADWLSGAALSAGWRFRSRLHLALGYAFFPAVKGSVLRSADERFDATVAVSRHPIALLIGRPIGLATRGAMVEAELAIIVDLVTARISTRRLLEEVQRGRTIDPAILLAPRLRFAYRPLAKLGFHATTGIEGAVRQSAFEVQWRDPAGNVLDRDTFLRPFPLRPALQLGVLLWL